MKNIDINFRSYLSMPDRVQENHQEAEQIMGKDQSSFDMLLLNRIERNGAIGDLPNKALYLDNDRLWEMIENIQIQMNDYLFSALSDIDEDNESHQFQGRWMTSHGIVDQVKSLAAIRSKSTGRLSVFYSSRSNQIWGAGPGRICISAPKLQ